MTPEFCPLDVAGVCHPDAVPTDDLASFWTSPDAYDLHVGRYGVSLAAALVERAGVGVGARVLDVGCGPGTLALVLSGVVGEPALVAAVDPPTAMPAPVGPVFRGPTSG
jgi:demethylmenaquinone methyltransferase/2-methoxy-6-polyprenyl-1,4-benzoquinol methylase